MAGCAFCKVDEMMDFVKFPREGKIPCSRGLRRESRWYAVLAPEQYSAGHTLVICRNPRTRNFEPRQDKQQGNCDLDIRSLHEEPTRYAKAWESLGKGIAEMRDFLIRRLEMLGEEELEKFGEAGKKPVSVHVLVLCEGVHHLHAHLIPRYGPYKQVEKDFYYKYYFARAKRMNNEHPCVLETFLDHWEKEEIHGIWYAAYREMNYDQTCFGAMSIEKQAERITALAEALRED